jgi:hypothetical protein
MVVSICRNEIGSASSFERARSQTAYGCPPGDLAMSTFPITLAPWLSQLPSKRKHYAREIYFRESWHDLLALAGEAAIRRWLWSTTFILFKPDAVANRALQRGLAAIQDNDFEILQSLTFQFDRLSMRELWRYELNIATMQRMAAIDLLLTAGPSLLVMLRDRRAVPASLSAAERLMRWKGTSRGSRPQNSLRTIMGALPGLLNFVHTPDEPADVIRELGVLAPRQTRLILSEHVVSPRRSCGTIDQDIRHCEARIPYHDLALRCSLDRIQVLAQAMPSNRRKALQHIDLARSTGCCDWQDLFSIMDGETQIDRWDRIAVAAWCTKTDIDGLVPILRKRATIR